MHLSRRSLLPLVALFAATGCGSEPITERPPDVVLLTIDTLRADRLGSYGYSRPTTPFIDRLADEGTLFEDVTSQYSWTVPSMISIFTGRYITGKRGSLQPDEKTLAHYFRRAGYTTIGAVANVVIQPDTGLSRGFDFFVTPDVGEFLEAEWSLDELWERCREPLEAVLASEQRPPVLVYLHALEPHDPYVSRPDIELAGAPSGFEAGGWHERELIRLAADADIADLLQRARDQRDRYDREVRALDQQVATLFDALHSLELDQNLVFALFSDHGEGLWDHKSPPEVAKEAAEGELPDSLRVFYQKHGAIQYQEVLRTPMILWGRGLPAGRRVRSPVENLDLLPTLLELTGLPPSKTSDGRSLVPLLTRDRARGRKFVFSHGVGTASVRELATGLKLIARLHFDEPEGRVSKELYDLGSDPLERTNLAPTNKRDAKRLLAVLLSWVEANPSPPNPPAGTERDERLRAIGYTESDAGD